MSHFGRMARGTSDRGINETLVGLQMTKDKRSVDPAHRVILQLTLQRFQGAGRPSDHEQT